ncbi:MAG: hypothetical protein V3V78_03405 [Candidatus Woesearchaeota archaeon]
MLKQTEQNPFLDLKWEYLRALSESDKHKVDRVFDPDTSKIWDLLGELDIKLRGQRNLDFKLDEPQTYNGVEYKFVKVKGHHYIPPEKDKVFMPSPLTYPDDAGMPICMKKISHNTSRAYFFKKIIDKINPMFIRSFEFEKGRRVDYFKPKTRPSGAMRKEEIETEVDLEEKCFERGVLAPVPIAKIKYPFTYKGEETYAYVSLIPDNNEIMAYHVHNSLDLEKLNDVIASQFEALKELHDKDIVHLFFHYGNSSFLGNTKRIVYHDFEDSIDILGMDDLLKADYKALDLAELLCMTNHIFLEDKEKGDELFESGLNAYFRDGCSLLTKKIAEDVKNSKSLEESGMKIYSYLSRLSRTV